MVITIQSFNKEDINTLYEKGRDDILLAQSGIEMLAETTPVLILDEPHKMSSDLSRSALNNLNPLFILRYSATHNDLDKSNLVYSLGPVEAHNLGLVKKIDVIGVTVKRESSLPFIKLVEVLLKPRIRAKVILKTRTAKGAFEKPILVSKGDYLQEKTKNPAYQECMITNISGEDNNAYIELTGGVKIKLNESCGDTYLEIAREQIKQTILTHLEKQKQLKQYGIKILSLFFIDEVSDYQEIDPSKEGGVEELAKIDSKKYLFVRNTFDELFNEIKKDYADWKDKFPEDMRGAYFSARKTFKSISQDEEKIDEILRDKEKLLSFDSNTGFIFTHSALGEGWDNPNVFNICTLRTVKSEITKRQTIGRGLRIPVTQEGIRYENSSENKLTVIANESYDEFARTVQEDYRSDGILDTPPIANRREKIVVRLRKDKFDGEFKELWSKLKLKAEYRCELDTNKLIETCKKSVESNLIVKKPIWDIRRAKIDFEPDGVKPLEIGSESIKSLEIKYSIPDVVTRISNSTGLTRRTITKILLLSSKLKDAFNNPEEFISQVALIINNEKVKMELDTVKYRKSNSSYQDDIFEREVSSYKTDVIDSERAVYDKVICDTGSEKEFAQDMSKDEHVSIFCKLPQNYYVPTPTGSYRPDWALIYREIGIEGKIGFKFYLIRETKFGYSPIKGTKHSIPQNEQNKIDCAMKHYNEIEGLDYKVVNSFDDFKQSLPLN